jgi:hypothetical protein
MKSGCTYRYVVGIHRAPVREYNSGKIHMKNSLSTKARNWAQGFRGNRQSSVASLLDYSTFGSPRVSIVMRDNDEDIKVHQVSRQIL